MSTKTATARLNTPRVTMVAVRCGACGHRFKAPTGCVWPVGCPRCESDAAPASWFRERRSSRSHLLELPIISPHHQPDGDRIRLHAEGLAREIQHDVMAPESEIADAIEAGIRKFAR